MCSDPANSMSPEPKWLTTDSFLRNWAIDGSQSILAWETDLVLRKAGDRTC